MINPDSQLTEKAAESAQSASLLVDTLKAAHQAACKSESWMVHLLLLGQLRKARKMADRLAQISDILDELEERSR